MAKRTLISIVEDDQPFRESMRKLMTSLGYIVEAFPSAANFLASPRLAETACLVADVQMPGMTGVELHRHLVDAGYAIPTILVTALGRRPSIILHRSRPPGRRGNRSARHHVLGSDRMGFVIEVDEIAGAHVHRADAEAHVAGIDPVEVDKPLERALQELGFVKARGLKSAVRPQPGSGLAKREKAGGAREDHAGRTQLVEERARQIALRSEGRGWQQPSRAAGWR